MNAVLDFGNCTCESNFMWQVRYLSQKVDEDSLNDKQNVDSANSRAKANLTEHQ